MTYFAGKMTRAILLSAITVLLLTGFAMAAESEQAVAVGATTGSSLRLREGPSTSASIVTTLDKGVAVAVLDDSTDGWYRVAYNGKCGYVSADYQRPLRPLHGIRGPGQREQRYHRHRQRF